MPISDSVISPESGRKVKVGSATYKRLVGAGQIPARPIILVDGKQVVEVDVLPSKPVVEKPKIDQKEKMAKLRALKQQKDEAKKESKVKVEVESKYKQKYKELKAKLEEPEEEVKPETA